MGGWLTSVQVETEDMIAKMKAETGMGMKMYRREAGAGWSPC